MCPHCGRDAPILYRGPLAFCSACNQPRVPLSATGVNLAGKPTKIGGTVASVAGWLVLAGTLGVALILGALLQAIFVGAFVGWAVGGVIAAIGIAASMVLLMGGRFLRDKGDQAASSARKEAVLALAQNQHGILRAPLVSQSLGVSIPDAEAFLTGLSRDPESGVTLEVDADGRLYFRFMEIAARFPQFVPASGTAPSPMQDVPGVRVEKTQLRGPDDAPIEDEETAEETRARRARM